MSSNLRGFFVIGALVSGLFFLVATGRGQVLPGALGIGPTAGNQESPAIARGDNDVTLAVWADGRADLTNAPPLGSRDIYAARVAPDGSVIDAIPLLVSQAGGSQTKPKVAWNGSAWLVAWVSQVPTQSFWTTQVAVARISASGVLLDPTPLGLVTFANDSNAELWSVASDGSNWAVFWKDYVNNNWVIQGRRVGPAGNALEAAPVNVTLPGFNQPYNGDVAFGGNQYLLVWNRWNSTSDDVYAQRISTSLVALAAPVAVTTHSDYDVWPKVASDGSAFFVVWERYNTSWGNQVVGSRVSAQGAVLDPAGITFPGSASFAQGAWPDVAWDGTQWQVAWITNTQVLSARASTLGSPSAATAVAPTSADQSKPAIAGRTSGGAEIVWEDARAGGTYALDVYGAAISAGGVPIQVGPVALGAPAQTQPRVAANGVDYMVAFRSEISGQREIRAQRVDAFGGSPDPEPIQVAPPNLTNSNPAIAWNGAFYLVVWDDGAQIRGRRLNQAGVPVDPAPFLIMPGITPRVAALGPDFLVVGSHAPTNPQFRFPYAIRVDTNGVAIGPPLQLGQYFATRPAVAALGTRWLVAWERHPSHDSPYANIHAAFVEASVTSAGEFPVSSSSGVVNVETAVSASPTTGLIAWQTSAVSNVNREVVGRRILATGMLLDPIAGFPIGSAPNQQTRPALGYDGVVHRAVWQDRRNNTFFIDERQDVFATRVTDAGTVLDPAGVPIATGFVNEMEPDVGGANGSAAIAYAAFHPEPPYAAYRIEVSIQNPPACPGSVQSYGAGCPGSGGLTPAIALGPCPTPGATVTLTIANAPSGAVGLVALGATQTALPLPNGCTLWVDAIGAFLPVTIGGSGTASVTATVPPGLPPLAIQAGFADPGAAGGLSTSNALLVIVQ